MQIRRRPAAAMLGALAVALAIYALSLPRELAAPAHPSSLDEPPASGSALEEGASPVVTDVPIDRDRVEPAAQEGQQPATDDVPVPKTFKEQLKAVVLSMQDHGGVSKDRLYRTLDNVDDVARNPAFNPDGKMLTAEQRIELAALVKEQNDASDAAGAVYGEASFQATLRALQMDQVVRIEPGRTAAENLKRINEAKELLSQRFGKELVDWRCTQSFRTASGGSDGESWIALTYYTAHQDPAAFEAAAAVMRVGTDKAPRYRRLFANLP